MGRSFGVGALELFMNSMRGIVFDDSFVPVGAPSMTAGQPGKEILCFSLTRSLIPSSAVHLQAGESWNNVYAAANAHGRSVAGGFSVGGTVGAAGGWSLGGGHSVLSPFLGLGTIQCWSMFHLSN